ncbi:MAG: hypothetical protein RMJ31_07400 [Nitrososphaerota archaeon]|nr:hypothetical protein [Nitrososphaerales archaeon]MDW8045573.1 hypothetical protein [Nitrososphaerota archaeon]
MQITPVSLERWHKETKVYASVLAAEPSSRFIFFRVKKLKEA